MASQLDNQVKKTAKKVVDSKSELIKNMRYSDKEVNSLKNIIFEVLVQTFSYCCLDVGLNSTTALNKAIGNCQAIKKSKDYDDLCNIISDAWESFKSNMEEFYKREGMM